MWQLKFINHFEAFPSSSWRSGVVNLCRKQSLELDKKLSCGHEIKRFIVSLADWGTRY